MTFYNLKELECRAARLATGLFEWSLVLTDEVITAGFIITSKANGRWIQL